LILGSGTRETGCDPCRETAEEQARRALRAANREILSARRLALVFAEEDAQITARLGGVVAMNYRFKCHHCGSGFSLEQQRDEHEALCGQTDRVRRDAGTSANTETRVLVCKYCGASLPSFGAYGRHRWACHKTEVLADVERTRAARKRDEKKIDAAIAAEAHGEAPAASQAKPQRSNGAEHEATCPTCGSVLPIVTARLVEELRTVGVPEGCLFDVARIARRVLGVGVASER
jgi:DNA-directed RNA polymerase subunit RPC12/RpoP